MGSEAWAPVKEDDIKMVMQKDGNLVIYHIDTPNLAEPWNTVDKPLWTSNTSGNNGAQLIW